MGLSTSIQNRLSPVTKDSLPILRYNSFIGDMTRAERKDQVVLRSSTFRSRFSFPDAASNQYWHWCHQIAIRSRKMDLLFTPVHKITSIPQAPQHAQA
jgi:hypothetical protein